jgi:hypothetical protein
MLCHHEPAAPALHQEKRRDSADEREHGHAGIGFAGKIPIERA